MALRVEKREHRDLPLWSRLGHALFTMKMVGWCERGALFPGLSMQLYSLAHEDCVWRLIQVAGPKVCRPPYRFTRANRSLSLCTVQTGLCIFGLIPSVLASLEGTNTSRERFSWSSLARVFFQPCWSNIFAVSRLHARCNTVRLDNAFLNQGAASFEARHL